MRTLLRMDSSFGTNPFRLSTNSSQSSFHKPTMTKSGSSSRKKWFTPSFHTSSSKKKSSRTNTSLSTQSPSQPPFQQPSQQLQSRNPFRAPSLSSQTSQSQNPFQDPSQSSQPQDRPSPPTYSTSMPTSSQKPSKRSKAWKKTKEFLSSIGEPPTAEYERQQAALSAKEGKIKTSGREAFGAVNYGPYGQGGPYQQGGRL